MPSVLRYCRANRGSQDKILACREFVTPLRSVPGMGWGSRHDIGSLGLMCEVKEGEGCGQGGWEAWRRALGGGVK